MIKPLFTSILLLLACASFAQQEKTYFLKNNDEYVNTRDSADFIRVLAKPDSGTILFNVFEFYKDGKKKMVGKASSIEPLRLEGQFLEFYPNGTTQRSGVYNKGYLIGQKIEYYPNGKTYTINKYPDEGKRNSKFLITANYDSLGNVLVENGNGYYKEYDKAFRNVVEEGTVKDGEKNETWKGYSQEFKASFTETYECGVLLSGKAVFDDGQISNYKDTRKVLPQFKGGNSALGRYLALNLRYPADARENNVQGTVFLSFEVGEDGSIRDVKVIKSISKSIDKEAIRVLNASPPWIPGMMFGRLVKFPYRFPLWFSIEK